MIISVNIQAESAAELREALLALGGGPHLDYAPRIFPDTLGFAAPLLEPSTAVQVQQLAAPAVEPAEKPKRTPKAKETKVEASAIAPTEQTDAADEAAAAPSGPAEVQGAPAGDDKPAGAVVELPASAPAAAEPGVILRSKLREVMTKHTPEKMHAIIKAFGVTAVKDIPQDKISEAIAMCDQQLAA